MKLLKKNLFGISMAFAMILGITLSFVPEVANANVEDEESDKIPCNSNACASTAYYYTPCDLCIRTAGQADGGAGECTS